LSFFSSSLFDFLSGLALLPGNIGLNFNDVMLLFDYATDGFTYVFNLISSYSLGLLADECMLAWLWLNDF
jgi:hypothetical protein